MDKYNTEGEKIEYKVGDIVTVISNLEEVNTARQEAGKDTWPNVAAGMLKYSGKSFEIASAGNNKSRPCYTLYDATNEYNYDYNWAPWMLTPKQCATRTKDRSIKI